MMGIPADDHDVCDDDLFGRPISDARQFDRFEERQALESSKEQGLPLSTIDEESASSMPGLILCEPSTSLWSPSSYRMTSLDRIFSEYFGHSIVQTTEPPSPKSTSCLCRFFICYHTPIISYTV